MPFVVFQHVDLLRKLAVALLTFVLFDALVKLHVVPQSVLRLHACGKDNIDLMRSLGKKQKTKQKTQDVMKACGTTEESRPFPHSAHRKSRISS